MAHIYGSKESMGRLLLLGGKPLGDLISRAYIEQTSLGWNVLFCGFWSISWRHAQEYKFAASPYHWGFQDNGEDWAGRAQLWMFDLFDLVWGLRNADEHGADPETQRMVRKARCKRAVHRLFFPWRIPAIS
jgi:hypothetical protein